MFAIAAAISIINGTKFTNSKSLPLLIRIMAAAAGSIVTPVYSLFGHASEQLNKKTELPEGCVLVLTEECGMEGSIPTHVYEAMSNPANLEYFRDPMTHRYKISELLKKNIQIFVGPTTIPDLSITFFNTDKLYQSKQLFISGVHQLPLQNIVVDGVQRPVSYSKIISDRKVSYSDIAPFFEHATFPRLNEVVMNYFGSDSNTNDWNRFIQSHSTELKEILTSQLEKELQIRISTVIEKVVAGDYISTLCRTVFRERSERFGSDTRWNLPAQIVRTLMPHKDKLRTRNSSLLEKAISVVKSRKTNARVISSYNARLMNFLSSKNTNEAAELTQSAMKRISEMPTEKINALQSTHTGDYLVHLAARRNDVPLLRLLIKKGAALNVLNFNKETALHTACISGSANVAVELLEHIDPTLVGIPDENGFTVLMHACDNNIPIVVAILLDNPIFEEHLNETAHDIDGDTALHLACQEDADMCCALLIRKNKNLLKEINNTGETPFMKALHSNSTECIKVISELAPEIITAIGGATGGSVAAVTGGATGGGSVKPGERRTRRVKRFFRKTRKLT